MGVGQALQKRGNLDAEGFGKKIFLGLHVTPGGGALGSRMK